MATLAVLALSMGLSSRPVQPLFDGIEATGVHNGWASVHRNRKLSEVTDEDGPHGRRITADIDTRGQSGGRTRIR